MSVETVGSSKPGRDRSKTRDFELIPRYAISLSEASRVTRRFRRHRRPPPPPLWKRLLETPALKLTSYLYSSTVICFRSYKGCFHNARQCGSNSVISKVTLHEELFKGAFKTRSCSSKFSRNILRWESRLLRLGVAIISSPPRRRSSWPHSSRGNFEVEPHCYVSNASRFRLVF